MNDIGNHPVVHVSFGDAQAFASWAGGRLPTEAEWEKAARGGLDQADLPLGRRPACRRRAPGQPLAGPVSDPQHPGGRLPTTAPVDSYRPNGFGLYNTSGNVWEWTADWFSPGWHRNASPQTRQDPQGPPDGTSKVVRGGSFLCHASYCNRYRVAARTQTTPDSSLSHTGFRLAVAD